MPIPAGMKVLDERDGLVGMPEAKTVLDAFAKREYAMHVGHFLSQYGRFPTDDEIVAAVRRAGV
jgi:hypothetical protein